MLKNPRLNASSCSGSDNPQFVDDQLDTQKKLDSDWWNLLNIYLGRMLILLIIQFFDSSLLLGHPEPEPEPKTKDAAESAASKDQLFCLNSLGVSVLKEVDLDEMSRVQLATGLTDFLKALWCELSHPPS